MSEKLLVADSFRVRTAAPHTALVRGWDKHRERFGSAVLATVSRLIIRGDAQNNTAVQTTGEQHKAEQAAAEKLEKFLAKSAAAISAYDEGMPRLELLLTAAAPETASHKNSTVLAQTADWSLHLNCNLRPLPQLQQTQNIVAARTLKTSEYLGDPQTKGPNIALFQKLTRDACGEVLLLGSAGEVLETTTAAVLWWQGDTLCRVADEKRVPSVTEQLVTECASQLGYKIAAETITPAALTAHEVWVVNALHGIRRVTQLRGVAAASAEMARFVRIRQALDTTWQTLIVSKN